MQRIGTSRAGGIDHDSRLGKIVIEADVPMVIACKVGILDIWVNTVVKVAVALVVVAEV
jgi:hypothetical protein